MFFSSFDYLGVVKMRCLNILMCYMESFVVFALFVVVPFIICVTIVSHSNYPLWSVVVIPISLSGFFIAVCGLRNKKEVDVYQKKQVVCRVLIWLAVILLFGGLVYLPRSWITAPLIVLLLVYLWLTVQLSRLCLSVIWRKEKIAMV